jgi:glycosyltransferase involved in cell wall biosynthesis
MKIAHIVCSYPPYYGGMGNVAYQIVSELIDRGHEVEVLTPQYTAPEKEKVKHVQRLAPSLSYGNAARLSQIGGVLDKFDVVHLHYPFFGTANLVRKWKIKNPTKPLVVTYHMDNRGFGLKGLIFKLYAKYWMPKILGVADICIASSFDYIESSDARELFYQNKNKWIELPFGVDTERFKIRKKSLELFKRHNLDPDIPTLLFVGGMDKAHYFKGIDVFLKSLLILKKSGLYFQVVLVGDGDLRSQFEIKATAFGLNNNIRFVGYVEDDELPYYYNMADLFILPSINQGEAFGMVLLEAMASGVPVVASDLPGVRSVARDAGIVVEPRNYRKLAESILELLSDQSKLEDLKKQARKITEEKYSWKPIVYKLEDYYKNISI